jgi:hypothetical protein
MSQKRPRENDGSEYSNTPGTPDRERNRATRRKSITHRSASTVRSPTRPSQSSAIPLYVDTVSIDQGNQGLSTSLPNFEFPMSPVGAHSEHSGHSGHWNVSSPTGHWEPSSVNTGGFSSSRHPHLEETPVEYPQISGYNYNFGSGEIGEPNIDMANNGPTFMNPFDSEGLPFAGLQLLHGYNTHNTELDSIELWNSLGPSAFDYGPEIPFALPEGNSEGHQHQQQQHN